MRMIPFLVILVLFSCKKDITPPNLGEISLNTELDTLLINTDTTNKILIGCLIEDEKDLNQYRIFSNNLITGTPSDSSLFSNFIYSVSNSIDVNPYMISDSLNLLSSATTGLYTINITAIDSEGNEGTGEEVILWIFSSGAPSFSISAPDFGNTSFSAGDTIFFQGSATDDVAIKDIYLNLYDEDGSHLSSDQFNYSDTVFTTWDFQNNDAQLELPTVLTTGKYLMRVRIIDNDGNLTMIQDSVNIN